MVASWSFPYFTLREFPSFKRLPASQPTPTLLHHRQVHPTPHWPIRQYYKLYRYTITMINLIIVGYILR